MRRICIVLAAFGCTSSEGLAATASVEVSGRYEYRTDAQSMDILGDVVCFFPDEASVSKVPRSPRAKRTLWFCFSAESGARSALGIPVTSSSCGYAGTARVGISSYRPYLGEGDDHDVADLVRVIDSTRPVEITCRMRSNNSLERSREL